MSTIFRIYGKEKKKEKKKGGEKDATPCLLFLPGNSVKISLQLAKKLLAVIP